MQENLDGLTPLFSEEYVKERVANSPLSKLNPVPGSPSPINISISDKHNMQDKLG